MFRVLVKRFSLFLCCLLFCFILPINVVGSEQEAVNISDKSIVTEAVGIRSVGSLFDGNKTKGWNSDKYCKLTLEHAEGFGSLYLIFGKSYGQYTITDNATGKVVTAGNKGYVHEYLDMVALFGKAPTSVTLEFDNGVLTLIEVEAYTVGKVPESVQIWKDAPEGKTDLILFATHSDDDQLFFAGLLPYYGVERGCEVLVVYLTNHWNTGDFRIHEALNGLWAVGVRNYPIFGPYADFADAKNLNEAFGKFNFLGHSHNDMIGFLVEQMRKYKPQVVVGHDVNGEYGHIQHRVYSLLTREAVDVSGDASFAPETAEKYGAWDVPKTYIHLYAENPIVMDWDQPMENFDGMTPYQVSKELGFPLHVSQQRNWKKTFDGYSTAASIRFYNPCYYGLYRSTVGADVSKNDMFENLVTYAEQARIEEEKARQEELERLAAEEEARKAAEAAAAEAAAAEAAQRAEELRLEQLRIQENALRKQRLTVIAVCAAVVTIAVVVVVVFRRSRNKCK